jgi:hypothetical protein
VYGRDLAFSEKFPEKQGRHAVFFLEKTGFLKRYFFAGFAAFPDRLVLGRVFPCVPRQILPRFERGSPFPIEHPPPWLFFVQKQKIHRTCFLKIVSPFAD